MPRGGRPLSHANIHRRHATLTRHGITYTNNQGQLVLNVVNDTQAKWEAAQRDVCAAEGREVKIAKSKWTNNTLRKWYKLNQTPPSLDTIVYFDLSFGAVKEFLRVYRVSFINITSITDNITLPFPSGYWEEELLQHNEEAYNVLRFIESAFHDSATSENYRDILQELTTDFGIMLPTEFDAKYSDIIESTNRFRCLGLLNWKTVLYLDHAGFPLAERDKPYPPLADAKKAIQDVVNSLRISMP